MKQSTFNGFSKDTFEFLKNLGKNNNKVWFIEHKEDFGKNVFTPLQLLILDLSEFMLTIDPNFEVEPKVNKTISRIYRDTRFSKDKSPFKTSMWVTFKVTNNNWKDAPAYFFEISSDSYRYGMGFYGASKLTMDCLRERIGSKTPEFKKAISFYSKQKDFVLEGENYKKILNEKLSPELLEWYQKKSLYLVANKKVDNDILSSKLIKKLFDGFRSIAPFYHYLKDLRDKA